MMKRATPKSVTIPNNGRTFVTRYERVTRNHLPANIRLRRPYKQRAAPRGKRCQRPQRVQQGRGLSSILNLLKKLSKHQLCENLVGWRYV